MTIIKPLVIIQARITSSRFRNKVLEKLNCGQSILEFLINRLKLYSDRYDLIVAIPDNKENNKAEYLGYRSIKFLGSEENVLKRFYDCANNRQVNTIIRINSDCPLIDPVNIINIIKAFAKTNKLYMSGFR